MQRDDTVELDPINAGRWACIPKRVIRYLEFKLTSMQGLERTDGGTFFILRVR